MCDERSYPLRDRRPPEEQLAQLIAAKWGIVVDARGLRSFIRSNWNAVSTLAHAIHNAPEPEKYPVGTTVDGPFRHNDEPLPGKWARIS